MASRYGPSVSTGAVPARTACGRASSPCTPVVALNRAVAVAEVHGPALALAALEDLHLPGYHLLPATRADLLVRLGRVPEAVAAYDEALALVGNDTERAFLVDRRSRLGA